MPFDLGDPVPLAIQVRNASDVLENATTVVCTITLPDATSATPTVTNGGAGLYSISYTPTQTGRHLVRWVATGTNACAISDVFDVRPGSSTNLLSLADAKLALNIPTTTTAQDEELRWYIEATTSLIESRIGPVVQRTVTEQVTGWDCLVLSCAPVVSVTTLTAIYSGATAHTAADVTVNGASGVVRLLNRGSFYGQTYTVAYVAGRSTLVEPRITQAAKVVLSHLWRTQRGAGGRSRGDDGTNEFALGYSLPNRALELLQFDLKTPGIA